MYTPFLVLHSSMVLFYVCRVLDHFIPDLILSEFILALHGGP